MTEELESPEDDPDLLRALGEVVVESTRLEHDIAQLVGIARDLDMDWLQETLSSPGGARRALRDLPRHIALDDGEAVDLEQLTRRVSNLLDDRSGFVHSVAMWHARDGTPEPVWWHPKSDVEHYPDVGQLRYGAHLTRRARGAVIDMTNRLDRRRPPGE